MPVSTPNFNFLAWLVTEIWRASQNEKWELLVSPDAPSGKFLYNTLVLVNAYKSAKFKLPSFISYADMKGVPK